jgi:endonuclease/exonuclease/phosphatase family metal-dependent hydrolase
MRRLLSNLGINRSLFHTLESTLVTLFFIQALRYLIGALYSRVASASLTGLIPPQVLPSLLNVPGVVLQPTVQQEIVLLVYMVGLTLIAILLGRFRLMLLVGVAITAAGRTLMVADTAITTAAAGALAVGGGLFYLTVLLRLRPSVFAPTMILAFAVDQLLRSAGNTADITLESAYFTVQVVLFLAVMVLGAVNLLIDRRALRARNAPLPERGLMSVWGGVAFGALMFLQVALLATPNVVSNRAELPYPLVAPLMLVATLLPLFPQSRILARQFINYFDSSVRGWVWVLMIGLALVIGTRFSGGLALAGYALAQVTVSLVWWWLVRPQATREINVSGLWMLIGVGVFTLLVGADVLTFEYAYVRDLAPPFEVLNATLILALRGLRGFGYALILLAALLTTLPLILSQRRIAWANAANRWQSALIFVGIVGAAVGSVYLTAPPLIFAAVNPQEIRVGTYNIHAGYSEFYDYNLEGIAQSIERSGVNVVLLQEVEAGRLTSFGVDQPLWLARRLNMDVRFFGTNERLQGLAVLSNIPIVFDDGVLLPSIGQQTGLQRVQILPAEGQVVTLYNTWLGLLLESAGGRSIAEQEQDQQLQLNDIIRVINQHHPDRVLGRTVLGGTFNNIPDSPLIQRVDDVGFSDPFAGSLIERSATLVRLGLNARVDYLWIYPEIANGVGVIESSASDHRLAFVSLLLTPQ